MKLKPTENLLYTQFSPMENHIAFVAFLHTYAMSRKRDTTRLG